MWEVDLVKLVMTFWLKPIVILCLFLTASQISTIKSAAYAYKILCTGVLAAFLVMLLSYLMPTVYLQLLPGYFSSWTEFSFSNSLNSKLNAWLVVVGVYSLVALFIIFYLLGQLSSTRTLIRQANTTEDEYLISLLDQVKQALGVNKKIKVCVSGAISSPAIFGFNKTYLLLPEKYSGWEDQKLVRVLTHELAHVVRNDWLSKVLMHLFCACFWFILPIWSVKKHMEWKAELAADDVVINLHNKRSDYAQDLLDIASEGMLEHALYVSLVRASEIYRRIDHVLDGGIDRDRHLGAWSYKYGFVAAILVLCFSCVQLSTQPNPYWQRSIAFPVPIIEKTISPVDTPSIHFTMPSKEWNDRPLLPRVKTEEMVIVGRRDAEFSVQESGNSLFASDLNVTLPVVSIHGPIAISMVTPSYPRRAIRRNIEGHVLAQFDVSEQGHIENIQLLSSEPKGVFDQAVEDALTKSYFTPMQMNGRPIRVNRIQEEYQFKLISRAPLNNTNVPQD